MKDQQVGHYKILEKLGAGGMGEVWLAEDSRLDRKVALKFLPHFASQDENEKARFIQEAKAAARLSHANIAQVYEIDEEDGRLYIVMEYVPGGSLRDMLDEAKGKSLPLEKVLTWVQETAEGLAEAHSQGIIHRDIKPDNLMLTEKGQVKITDFGLARMETATRLTASGTTLGTVNYMSPELITDKDVDHRSDLFSLGVTFYEMLSGQQVFTGQDANSTYYAILNAHIDPLTRYRKDLPDKLEDIVTKLLEREPINRYQSAAEIVTDVRRITTPMDTTTLTAALRHNVTIQWKRISAVAGWVIAAVLAVLLFSFPRSAPIDFTSYRYTPFATDSEPERCPSWSPQGDYVAYVLRIDGLYQLVYRGLHEPAPHQLTNLPEGVSHGRPPFWAPNGERIYFFANGGLWSVGLGGDPTLLIEEAQGADLHPTEPVLAFSRSRTIYLATPEGEGVRPFLTNSLGKGDGVIGQDLHFSPDGRYIGYAGTDSFWILPWPEGSTRRIRTYSVRTDFDLRSPNFDWLDSHRVVMGSLYQKGLRILDTRFNRLIGLSPQFNTEIEPAVSPDGQTILFTTDQRNQFIVEISIDEPTQPRIMLDSVRLEYSPSWLPSGREFAYINDRMGETAIWIHNIDTNHETEIVTLSDFDAEVGAYAFRAPAVVSPDGEWIAFQLETNKREYDIWFCPTRSGKPTRVFPVTLTSSSHSFVSWSPDSRYLVGAPTIRVVKRGDPGSVSPPLIDATAMYPLWSPDNRWIACFPYTLNAGFADSLILVSPDGNEQREIRSPVHPGGANFVPVWSADGSTIYIASSRPGETGLFAIDVESGDSWKVYDFPGKVEFWYWASTLFGSMSPDGQSFLTTARTYDSNIWMLSGFHNPGK
ncbi:protein kinase [Gemmatimonadota bacterium]